MECGGAGNRGGTAGEVHVMVEVGERRVLPVQNQARIHYRNR